MAVGLGCFFVLSVRAIQTNLIAEFTAQIGATSPDLVLIDVQRDQVDGVQATVAPYVHRAGAHHAADARARRRRRRPARASADAGRGAASRAGSRASSA